MKFLQVHDGSDVPETNLNWTEIGMDIISDLNHKPQTVTTKKLK